MFERMLFIISMMLVFSACSPTNGSSSTSLETITDTPEIESIATSSVEVIFSPTTAVDIVQVPTSVVENEPSDLLPSCVTSNEELEVYVIGAGDTLSSIASLSGTTAEYLADLNCLEDANLITVGQVLYVPHSFTFDNEVSQSASTNNTQPIQLGETNNSSAIDLSNIPRIITTFHGSIIPSTWIVNHENVYVVEESTTINLTWNSFPSDMGITQVGFVLKANNNVGGYTLVGTDTNLSDGISASWTVPANAQYDIFAVGQIPGQSELVVSDRMRLGSRNSNVPLQLRRYGTSSTVPVVEMTSPGQVTVQPDSVSLTIEWISPSSYGYHILDTVYFYYQDENGTNLIGTDEDDSDGISISFTTFPSLSGIIYAEGEFIQSGRQVFHVALAMPDIQIEAEIEGCMFFGYGIGAPHPIYPSPDSNTTPIAQIQAIDLYPVLQQGETFHQIDLETQTGWIDSTRGDLVGDC